MFSAPSNFWKCRVMTYFPAIISGLLLSFSMLAQDNRASESAPAFEVASVRPADPSQHQRYFRGGPGTGEPGQVTAANQSLMRLIVRAYGLLPWRVIGPDWLDIELYDIVAKVPRGATPDQINLMLQRLLAERFGLVVHRETRSVPVYELTVSKGGLKMKPAAAASADQPGSAPNGRPAVDTDFCPVLPPGVPRVAAWDVGRNTCMTGRMQSLSALASMFENMLMRPVLDGTAVAGVYDFRLVFLAPNAEGNIEGAVGDVNEKALSPERAAAAAYPTPNLIVAARTQLGLKLQSTKAPAPVLVVDRANRKPTGN